ncbi:MAG TPA: ATP-binding protein [Bacteroidales bacterium]|nr:ATP-binding protein [Bacteroidales bacterium]
MKYYKPRVVSLINSVLITAIYLVLIIISALIFRPEISTFLLICCILAGTGLIFLLSYLVFRFTLERFIYSKIRLIYKTIHSTKAAVSPVKTNPTGNNLLDQVSREVEDWETATLSELDQLKQLEQYRKDFLGNVAHELKNPIFTIQGYILTLLEGGLEDTTINKEYLKRAGDGVDHLIRIVEDLEEITQLETGEMKLKIIRFDLIALIREVMSSFEMQTTQKNVTLTLNDGNQPVIVEGDRERIRHVLINLIDNAICYGKPDNNLIKIAWFDMDEYILAEVTDNGIGIAQQELPRIFERFYRTEKGRVASRKGRGLGLAIVKHIMEAHHQTINVRSTPGVGTTFGFTLKKSV